MHLPPPLLAQMSEPSRPVLPLPSLKVGRDGLLRREGMSTPIVEELVSDAVELEITARSVFETKNTRSKPDQPDPLIRSANRLHSVGRNLWLSTIMTKRADDTPDPFGTRRSARFSCFINTTFSNGQLDQPDPDRLRKKD